MKKNIIFLLLLLISFTSFSRRTNLSEELKKVTEKQMELDERLFELEYDNATEEEKRKIDKMELERLESINRQIQILKEMGYTSDEEEVLKDDKDGRITRVIPKR